MNRGTVIYTLGWIMSVETIFTTLSVIAIVVYRESIGFIRLGVVVVYSLLGFLCTRKRPCTKVFFVGEGLVAVPLGWVVLSSFGCIPFIISGEIPHIIDIMFEIVSGFTTTGSNTTPKVEDMSHTTLVWRSFSHWIGDMGILVFILAILPMTGNYNIRIMRAESPGLSMGKLVPRIQITAGLLCSIYFYMTTVMMIFLLLGEMSLFNSICTNFGAVGIGGFACRNSGQVDYTVHQQTAIIIFMLLFGVDSNVHCLLLIRRPRDAGRRGELRGRLVVMTIAILLVTINTRNLFPSLPMASYQVTFQVSSIITTTGYSTINYNSWLEFSKAILLLIMSIGTCVDSTGGGAKTSRVMIVFKEIRKEMTSIIHPCSARVLKSKGKPLEHNILKSPNAYIIVYFIISGISIPVVSLDNYDLMTSFSVVTVNLNNISPGTSVVGPSSSYSMISYLSKTVLIFGILAGGPELFPILALLSPGTWKRS